MTKSILALSLFLAAPAFAASASPVGNGNFRRAEALKAAGASNLAHVIGMSTSRNQVKAPKDPAASRILFVDTGRKVSIVKAPLDKSRPVTLMTKAQVNKAGLITQAQAYKQALENGGYMGSKGAVKLAYAGMGSYRGSYLFKQSSPRSVVFKQYGATEKASDIVRSVSVTGAGESARAGKIDIIARPKSN